jgi:hypothetical protein
MAVIALSAACVLSLILVGRLEGLVGHPEIAAPLWFQLMTHGLAFFANLALGPGVAVLLTWVALRQRIAKAWPLLAMLVIALLGVHVFANFHAPDAERRHIGFGIMPLVGLWTPAKITAPEMAWPFLIIQYVLTLTPALWLLVFARQVEPR